MEIKTIIGTYNSNTYVCEFGHQIIIIDSGAPLEAVKQAVGGQTVLAVLVTHEHFDHLTNGVAYARHWGVPLYGTREVLDNLKYYRPALPSEEEPGVVYPIEVFDPVVDFRVIADEKPLVIDKITVEVFLCPGHSAGSVVFLLQGCLFTGDLLFARGVGNVFMTNGKKYLCESLARVQNLTFVTAYHGHGQPSAYQEQLKNIRVWLKWLSR